MGAFYRSFLVLFLLFGAELVTADLTELENRIIAIAERDKEAAIALLARTVNINSGTMNHLGVKAVGDILIISKSAVPTGNVDAEDNSE